MEEKRLTLAVEGGAGAGRGTEECGWEEEAAAAAQDGRRFWGRMIIGFAIFHISPCVFYVLCMWAHGGSAGPAHSRPLGSFRCKSLGRKDSVMGSFQWAGRRTENSLRTLL